nr:MAG TPA: hypothetical protein [Bacteriophage sp.]
MSNDSDLIRYILHKLSIVSKAYASDLRKRIDLL